MGEGEEGEGVGQPQPGGGNENAGGDQEGQHLTEVDVSLEELADILADELELPRIKPRGEHRVTTVRDKYTGIRQIGPASLRHFKRTYREALKRQVASGIYDPADPVIIPIKRDMRFRSWNEVKKPQSNAAIIYMMDVSGSMGDEQKELVRLQAFWIDTWLRRNYEGVESRYIVHDVRAGEVDKQTFYSMREDGGTRISSAYSPARKSSTPTTTQTTGTSTSSTSPTATTPPRPTTRSASRSSASTSSPAPTCSGTARSPAYGSGNFINVLAEHFPDGR
jgi:uncharacterized sporulation protein YeaH/YhbH (DUF444 family)